jgi:aldose 1-epimerase
LLNIDGDQISIGIDLDQGARLASVQWRDMQFAVPFAGDPRGWGWYAMAPWAGRIKNGVVKDKSGAKIQLPTTFDPPHAIHGYGFFSSWEDLGEGRQLLEFPAPYNGASVTQQIEILDDAIRWSLDYEAGDCQLPFSLGFHPWFARDIGRGDTAEISFAAQKMFKRGTDYLPTGELIEPTGQPWDDTFKDVVGVPEIIWPGAARVSIESDSPYWTVYTEHEDGICVEPVTAPPDCQNLGIAGDSYIEMLITFAEDY